jgi:hypothetical protein
MKSTLLILLLLAGPALAQDEARVRAACTADALTFCAQVIPRGRAAIVACMTAHQAKLSAECLAAIRAGRK